MAGVPKRVGEQSFGLCIPDEAPSDDACFTYVAGVEVEAGAKVPDGMVAVVVPAGAYAVFTHAGHIAHLRDTVMQIWGTWLPQSPHRHEARPDFELYDDRFDPHTGRGEVDIYVPIARLRRAADRSQG